MNLFLVALSSGPAPGAKVTQAVRATAERVPYLSGNKCHEHVSSDRRLAAAWIAHRPEQVGGVRYWITRDDQLALFCGRPILRTDTGFDGRRPLSPELYLTPTQDWEDYLDGRFTVVRCSGHHVSVVTDPLGADRVFTAEGDGVRWIGNNADTIALASNARGVDTLALASLLTFGWSFGGRPLHAGIERLRPNATHVFDASGNGRVRWDCRRRSSSWSSGDAQFDPARAAEILAGVTQAMMDWPQRPVTVSVTGGRDSRLTFAAALGG